MPIVTLKKRCITNRKMRYCSVLFNDILEFFIKMNCKTMEFEFLQTAKFKIKSDRRLTNDQTRLELKFSDIRKNHLISIVIAEEMLGITQFQECQIQACCANRINQIFCVETSKIDSQQLGI